MKTKSASTSAEVNKVLICVLNWGLGHASRTVPVIKECIRQGWQVHLASDGRAGQLLRAECPELSYHEIPGYGVTYPFKSMRKNIFLQWPRILRAIYLEHQWTKSIQDRERFDVIISDNRYGCWSRSAHNIIITHQCQPLTGGSVTDLVAARISDWLLSRFEELWLPDHPELNLSGRLGRTRHQKIKYLGVLSRAQGVQKQTEDFILAILSGPEPQRSKWEQALTAQLLQWDGPFKLVRGVTEGTSIWRSLGSNGEVVDYLSGSDWEECLTQASLVISRSGYSSILDYIKMGKKAIMIPTPGQYEQEYLAEHVRYPAFYFSTMEALQLPEAYRALDDVHVEAHADNLLSQTIEGLVKYLNKD